MAVLVITVSWLLNACMDAIDHGKGAQRLNLLWHTLKWLSYAIPFGYIMWVTDMRINTIIILTMCVWVAWEALYRYLRYIDFHEYDKF